MSIEMDRFETKLAAQPFKPLNGKADPFDLISSVTGSVGDAHEMMVAAGVLGWNPEMITLSGFDGQGNIYEAPENNRGIVVPNFPGGPKYFGQAHKNYRFIRPEALVPLIDAIVAHGNPLTGVAPGPVTRFFFGGQDIDLVPYSAEAKALVGEIIRFRWQFDLGNTGKASLKIRQRGMRLWCANGCTTDMMMGSVSIAHNDLAPAKIDATLRHILNQGNIGLEKWITDARRAIARKMTLTEATALWTELFEWEDGKAKRALTTQEAQQAALTQLWRSSTQQVTFPDTAWAFFNATTEYLDHNAIVRFGADSREVALARRVVEAAPAVEKVKDTAWQMAIAN
jgi:hypothetical protein